MAVLAAVQGSGWIQLREHPVRGAAAGQLSGALHAGQAVAPPVRAQVEAVDWSDPAQATLRLTDGRVILVELMATRSGRRPGEGGQGGKCGTDPSIAIVGIDVDALPAEMADLPLEQLLQRMELVSAAVCVRQPFNEDDLQRQADEAAACAAAEAWDILPAGMPLPEGWEAWSLEKRRESLQHWVAKQAIARAGRVAVPTHSAGRLEVSFDWIDTFEGLNWSDVPPEVAQGFGSPSEFSKVFPATTMQLQQVRLERGLAGKVPDIQAQASDEKSGASAGRLVIEIVNTNMTPADKVQLFAKQQIAVLEIRLRDLGAGMTPSALEEAVVQGLVGKHWLHHPAGRAWRYEVERRITVSVDYLITKTLPGPVGERFEPDEVLPRHDAHTGRRQGTSIEVLRESYRAEAAAWLSERAVAMDAQEDWEVRLDAAHRAADLWPKVRRTGAALHYRGIPGALDADFLLLTLPHLMCVQSEVGEAQALCGQKVQGSIGLFEQAVGDGLDHPALTLWLVAVRTYASQDRPYALQAQQASQFAGLRNSAFEALQRGDTRFLWAGRHQRLIMQMFPELAEGMDRVLAMAAPRRRAEAAEVDIAPPSA